MENIVIDIHGVLDANPSYFVKEAFRVLSEGGTVHIVTGIPWSDEVEEELLSYANGFKYWTHFHSIVDHLIAKDEPRYLCQLGRTWFYDDDAWDRVKGEYCAEHNIHRIYDDTIEYRKYMPEFTNFFLYSHDPQAHIKKLATTHLSKPDVYHAIKEP
jgi:hypothetical protein